MLQVESLIFSLMFIPAKFFLVLWYEVFSDQNLILMVAYAHSICSVVKSQILWKYVRTLKA